MAKSGSFGNTFTTGYRIQVDWSATQDTPGNKSTITCKLFLMSMTSYHNINSSQAKDLSISIAGSSNGDTANVSLNPGQKKQLHSWSRTVSHDSNGKLKAALSAWVDLELTLGGSRVNRVSTSQTVTLNDIARESSLSSNANWTAGSDKAISI